MCRNYGIEAVSYTHLDVYKRQVEAISAGDIYKIDPESCTDCGSCADVCPVEATQPA